jgi:hypothetical protein
LEILLKWKGVAVPKKRNVAKFAEGGAEEVSIPAPWTEIDQAELD